jgi:Protein of unknown function (DUF2817)
MKDLHSPFAESYAEARVKFLRAATDAGLSIRSHEHPERGREDETLAIDVALQGSPDAAAMLVISSGCHGIEGFCGSAVQVALLQDQTWLDQASASGLAVLYIHALNPHGFSWLRRVTHENVDLNRNFMDFSREPPRNVGYDEIAHLAVPPDWPPSATVTAEVQRYIADRGFAAFVSALSGGQYHHPLGQMYGGQQPTWSNLQLRQVLRAHASEVKRLGWIDIHTGLGPCGHGERIFFNQDDQASLERTRSWWGQKVTSYYDGSSDSPPLSGNLWCGIREECPQAEYTGIALEFGTLHYEQVMLALTADHWLNVQTATDPVTASRIRQEMREAFFIDTAEWKEAVLTQAFRAAAQAVVGLRA